MLQFTEVDMKNILHNIKLYFLMFSASIKSLAQYRVDFIVGMISQIFYELIELIFIFIIFRNTTTINGWNFYEVLLLCGLLNISLGYVDLFFDEMYEVGPHYIKDGTFDLILLRPIHPIISIMSKSQSATSFGYIVIGMIMSVFSLIKLNIIISFQTILFILFITLIGGIVIGAIITILCVSSFWVMDSNEIMWSAFTMYRFSEYPLSVYNNFIKFLLIFIFPFAFVSFFPASYLLNRDYGLLSFIAPFIAIIFWIIAIKLWNWGLKHYKSSGT